jgi:hypothetical protein
LKITKTTGRVKIHSYYISIPRRCQNRVISAQIPKKKNTSFCFAMTRTLIIWLQVSEELNYGS